MVINEQFKELRTEHLLGGLIRAGGEAATRSEVEMDNEALEDDERRLPGNRVDGRFSWTKLNTEICVVEVSGPPNEKDHTHFADTGWSCKWRSACESQPVLSG